jgi:hypothetical protein
MSVKEQALGKGTIAYAGESWDYWASKTARLPRGRARITAVIAGAALLLLAWLVSPLGPSVETARVTGSRQVAADAPDASPGAYAIQVVLPDGRRGSFTSTTIPPIAGSVTVTVFADGHLAEGDAIVVSLWLIGLTLGGIAAGRGLWQYRHRHLVTSFR